MHGQNKEGPLRGKRMVVVMSLELTEETVRKRCQNWALESNYHGRTLWVHVFWAEGRTTHICRDMEL
jgi:hypothetical protein